MPKQPGQNGSIKMGLSKWLFESGCYKKANEEDIFAQKATSNKIQKHSNKSQCQSSQFV